MFFVFPSITFSKHEFQCFATFDPNRVGVLFARFCGVRDLWVFLVKLLVSEKSRPWGVRHCGTLLFRRSFIMHGVKSSNSEARSRVSFFLDFVVSFLFFFPVGHLKGPEPFQQPLGVFLFPPPLLPLFWVPISAAVSEVDQGSLKDLHFATS